MLVGDQMNTRKRINRIPKGGNGKYAKKKRRNGGKAFRHWAATSTFLRREIRR